MKQIVYVASPDSQQIHVWQMDGQGMLTLLQVVNTLGKGQPMAIHPKKTHLYIGIRPVFSVISYCIDEEGLLTEDSIAPLLGSPTQITTDLQGTTLYSVSYSSSYLSVSPIDERGVVGAPQQTLKGLTNCHSANVDTTNQVLWVPCLQEDRIRLYKIGQSGCLMPFSPAALECVAGSGPRHMAFHHGGNYAYVINELSGTVDVIDIHSAGFGPRIIQTLDIMPATFSNIRWAADIHITIDDRWLYCCDRKASIISRFSVSEDGSVLSLLGYQATETQIRGFNIDPQGRFLVAAGQKSDHIAVYAIDAQSGVLSLIERYAVGRGPMWVSILVM
ncbi:6-phosphogluconolactonase [Sodalis endosymbiont of Henestaris halophilus]|uniref:6-phosphogluconolactonase n=1 Tax=Sodalis endosymbiont of Henestaris halophilus TaxID=1929246 RepID=UPI000BBF5213|nr:6-phosphogluconolactonase [Sodalis endosymbiont of Henestaris halophilus]SNC59096.1 6-phosphogluconolactonase [Sodalis endosymbiont of Henestaris halophilus]